MATNPFPNKDYKEPTRQYQNGRKKRYWADCKDCKIPFLHTKETGRCPECKAIKK